MNRFGTAGQWTEHIHSGPSFGSRRWVRRQNGTMQGTRVPGGWRWRFTDGNLSEGPAPLAGLAQGGQDGLFGYAGSSEGVRGPVRGLWASFPG